MVNYKIVVHAYSLDELVDNSPITYTFQEFPSLMTALKFFELAKIINVGFIPLEAVESYISATGNTEINLGPIPLSHRDQITSLFERLLNGMDDIRIIKSNAEQISTHVEIGDKLFFND